MPGKAEKGLSEDSALLHLVMGIASGKLNELFDLSKLPRKMMEIERKYQLPLDGKSPGLAMTDFMTRFGKFLEERKIVVEEMIPFVGIDQYFIIAKGDEEFVFRYRVGVNRPPQLSVKIQVTQGSNFVRGEIPLDVGYEELENVRAFMAVICRLADSYQNFVMRQSGNIWTTRDAGGNPIEVVVYKTTRLTPPEKMGVFVEIEALDTKDVPLSKVTKTITKYEKALQLSDFICQKSVAEMFRC